MHEVVRSFFDLILVAVFSLVDLLAPIYTSAQNSVS
jgi:hypothetical protein